MASIGLFSRKDRDKSPQEFASSRDFHDSFSIYVNEAKGIAQFFGIDFEKTNPHQKVFSFLLEKPACVSFIVILSEGIQLIQCAEGVPIIIEIPYSELIEAKILEDYESDNLLSGSHDFDSIEVHHLRTPRLAMSLVTKDHEYVLIAHSGQVEFVEGYLQAGILFWAK